MSHHHLLPSISRRDLLGRIGAGFGTIGLAGVTPQAKAAGPISTSSIAAGSRGSIVKHTMQVWMGS